MSDYRQIVAKFAADGAKLIRENPLERYQSLGREARRPLEPGWIPVAAPALLTTVSYYPNESDLDSPEYRSARTSFETWGRDGTVDAYEAAYADFLSFRGQIPFYQKWERSLYNELGLAPDQTAWLPFFKLPMKQESAPDVESVDAQRDLHTLWDQLNLLKPTVVLLQSQRVASVLEKRLENLRFIQRVEVQKLNRRQPQETIARDMRRIASSFQPYIDAARAEILNRPNSNP